jgi:hypothetical protein
MYMKVYIVVTELNAEWGRVVRCFKEGALHTCGAVTQNLGVNFREFSNVVKGHGRKRERIYSPSFL